jgi:hypothetical protein
VKVPPEQVAMRWGPKGGMATAHAQSDSGFSREAGNTPISSVGNFFYSEMTVIGSSLQSSSMVQCSMLGMYSMLENVRDGWSMWYLFPEVLERIEDKYVNFSEISDGHPNM